ncbi:MAG: hypothetical protein QXK89_10035 [Candidatus Bathyarchaeia archaeon]
MMNNTSLKRGFTWRVLSGLILVALLFMPINIYLNLMTGSFIPVATIYLVIILISELARYSGNPLSKHEIFVLYSTMGTVAMALPPYYYLIYRSFFVNTPVTYAFKIDGIPIPYLVEDWLCPPPGSLAHAYRTLLQFEWLKPIIVSTVFSLLAFMADIGLSILFSHLTVRVLNLRFPFATIDWSLIETIAEHESERLKMFMTGFYPGLIYGMLVYGSSLAGIPLVPLPWADFTWLTEKYLPGALIGISTEPLPFILGLILPMSITGNILLGSLIIWVLLNYFFTINPSFFPMWVQEYSRGMTISFLYQRSLQRIWISPQFGLVIGLAVALIFSVRKNILKIFSGIIKLKKVKNEFDEFPSVRVALILFMAGSIGSVLLYAALVPEMPLYIPLLSSLMLSFLIGALAAFSIGEIGTFPTLMWPWQAIVYFSPYKGFSGWVSSPYICLGTPGSVSQIVKLAYLSETKPKDYFKAWTIAFVLNLTFGFVIVDMYWRLAPIPSSVYPGAMIYWPINATNDALYATRQIKLDPMIILISIFVSSFLYFASVFLQRIGLPFLVVPFVMGCYILPMSAIVMFIGSISSHLLSRYFGREKWTVLRGVFSAGLFAGIGVSLGVGISLMLISRASWVWPW